MEEGEVGGCRICGSLSLDSVEVVVVTWQQAQVLKTLVFSSSAEGEMMMMEEGDLDPSSYSSPLLLPHFDFDEDAKKTRLCLGCRSTLEEILTLRQQLDRVRVKLRESVEGLRSRIRKKSSEEEEQEVPLDPEVPGSEGFVQEDLKEEPCEEGECGIQGEEECTTEEAGPPPSVSNQEPSSNFKCDHCHKSLSSKRNLRRHIRKAHGMKRRKIQCPECGKLVLKLEAHLAIHEAKRNDEKYKKHPCRHCSLRFQHLWSLERHEKSFHAQQHQHGRASKTGPLKCDMCHQTFFFSQTLDRHILRAHSGREKTQCPQCGKLVLNVVKHETRVHSVTLHPCPNCSKSFRYPWTLARHKSWVHDQGDSPRVFKCDICALTFSYKRILETHKREAHGVGGKTQCPECGEMVDNIAKHRKTKYPCPYCPKVFCYPDVLRDHKALHTQETPFCCEQCNRNYKRQRDLQLHMKTDHNVAMENPFKCLEEGCVAKGVTFRWQKTLDSHMKRVHPREGESEGPKTSTAVVRQQRTRRKYVSYVRVRSQAKKQTFVCPTCGKTFGQKVSLVAHEFSHKPDVPRPFPCDKCEASYPIKRQLEVDILRSHEGVREMCQVCGKLVRCMYAHMVGSHTVEADKKYPCPHCPKRFVTPQLLKNHVRTHTGEEALQV